MQCLLCLLMNKGVITGPECLFLACMAKGASGDTSDQVNKLKAQIKELRGAKPEIKTMSDNDND